MELYPRILGCLLGTAVGDAVGLRREGLTRQRAMRMYGGPPLEPSLLLRRGFCSDDTEHTQMVGRSLALSGGDPREFELRLAADLKKWLLTAPAGVGFATLRACLKLLLGCGPNRSGVDSAGNGPAMRSALIGIYAKDEEQLTKLVRASTRLTHTDPRAEEGALLVARAAQIGHHHHKSRSHWIPPRSRIDRNRERIARFPGAAAQALIAGKTCLEFAQSQGWSRGVSGYVNQTVPAALYCWARSPDDFRRCVENAVLLGGDTDSVAAITGAICGAHLGSDGIPIEWIERLAEWPRTTKWMRSARSRYSRNQRKIKRLKTTLNALVGDDSP